MPKFICRPFVSAALCGVVLIAGCAAAAPSQGAGTAPLPAATPATAAPAALPDAPPPLSLPDTASFVLMDARTGEIITSKSPNLAHAPASLTKLMTAYLTYQAIARGTLKPDQTVPVSDAAWKAGGSRMFISPRMSVTVDQLLHGLIIDSGNDAAVALAEAVSGTQDAFVTSMNAEAAKLGLTGTHYANVSGLPDPTLHTTAADVARLSLALIRDYPQVLQISAQKHYTFDKITQRSWNPVLFKDPSVDGLKTGLTDAAGHCIDATAQRNGNRLIAVEMGASSWSSGTAAVEALLDYGYHFYQDATVATAGTKLGQLTDARFQPETVPVGPAKDLVLTLPIGALSAIKPELQISANLPAHLPRGSVVGTIAYSLGGKVLATVPAETLADAKPAGFVTRMMRRLRKTL